MKLQFIRENYIEKMEQELSEFPAVLKKAAKGQAKAKLKKAGAKIKSIANKKVF